MRILYFSRSWTTHDHRFLSAMSAASHEVSFLRLEGTGSSSNPARLPPGVHAVDWPTALPYDGPSEWLRMAPAFEQIVEQVRPEIVHAGPVQSCAFIAALCYIGPLIAMSWGSDLLVDAKRDELWSWITRYTLGRADAIICDSDAVRESIRGLQPSKSGQIVQFPWGIDLNLFSPGADTVLIREQAGWQDAIILISSRQWEPIHRIDTLLEAFSMALQKEQRLRLLLLGSGSLTGDVERLLDDRRLRGVVQVTGFISQDRMPHYFRAADVYMSCTKSDGTSISLLEAMATGLMPVVTDGPGNREWLTHGVNGWLAARGDPADFATCLLEAARVSVIERARIARLNRQIVESKADWTEGTAKLLATLDMLSASDATRASGRARAHA